MNVTQTGVSYDVQVNGETVAQSHTVHGSLCLALRGLYELYDTVAWCGPCDVVTIIQSDMRYNKPYHKAIIVLVTEGDTHEGNGVVVKRWDVPEGRCTRLKWIDDESTNGRIEML